MLVLSGTPPYYLIPGVDYIIGRKTDSDILLTAKSVDGVSRNVCMIFKRLILLWYYVTKIKIINFTAIL